MTKKNLISTIKNHSLVSIVGMDKNVGKTTVLNYILNNLHSSMEPVGITSIGRDGEDKDLVTSTEKPQIYIKAGTIIATARQCLSYGDITREILGTTDINTAMGKVVLVKALSDGYVDLGGPSLNSQMLSVCSILKDCNCNFILVDGALSRRTFASPSFADGIILSTGASLSKNIDTVVEKTSHTVSLLSLECEEDDHILSLCRDIPEDIKVLLISKDKTLKSLDVVTALSAAEHIVDSLDKEICHIFIRGALSNTFFEQLIKHPHKIKNKTFIAEDGTKLFLNKATYNKFLAMGAQIKVLKSINLLALTCNPVSPYGYEFPPKEFLCKLRDAVSIEVFDVMQNI